MFLQNRNIQILDPFGELGVDLLGGVGARGSTPLTGIVIAFEAYKGSEPIMGKRYV